MTARMPLTVAERGRPILKTLDYAIEMSYGDNDCAFALRDIPYILHRGHVVYIDGTQFGGVVDEVNTSVTEGGTDVVYKGRTWQGVLDSTCVFPPAGNTHRYVSGDASGVISQLLAHCGLSSAFDVAPSGVTLPNTRIRRFASLYAALRMSLGGVDARLSLTMDEGRPVLSAVSAYHYGRASSERVYFTLNQVDPVNCLVGLGKGEGTARAVSVWYADRSKAVSQTQTLFGLDAKVATYQLTSEEAATLPAKTRNKLRELQDADEAVITGLGTNSLDVGDYVEFFVASGGNRTVQQVNEIVMTSTGGVVRITPRFGVPDWPDDED